MNKSLSFILIVSLLGFGAAVGNATSGKSSGAFIPDQVHQLKKQKQECVKGRVKCYCHNGMYKKNK